MATLLRRLVARPQLINKMTVQRALDLMARPHAREALRRIGAGLIADEAPSLTQPRALRPWAFPASRVGRGRCDQSDRCGPASAFGGESLIVADTGHLPHIESPRAVNARIVEFLSHVMAG